MNKIKWKKTLSTMGLCINILAMAAKQQERGRAGECLTKYIFGAFHTVMMNGSPREDDNCPCGKLYKDSSYGKFGSSLGDDAIETYRRK